MWRIDRSTIDGLAGETRALWYETVARALVAKLDEASLQRANQARDLHSGDRAIARLVCPEGVRATSAILLNGAEAGAGGVGKSTVAALQASLLGRCIIDLDQRFTKQFGHGQDAS